MINGFDKINYENNLKNNYHTIYKTSLYKNNSSDEDIILIIANILEEIVINNSNKISIQTLFDSSKPPQISIKNYLLRFFKFSKCSIETYILSLIYLDKYNQISDLFYFNRLNCHK